MNDKLLTELIEELKNKGVEFDNGLSATEIDHIEQVLCSQVPAELRQLLTSALPVSLNGRTHGFHDWRNNTEAVLETAQKYIEDGFVFDIEHGYWNSTFGKKPNDLEAAKQQALAAIRELPRLMPVYTHRYMPTKPHEGGAVISVRQATDTVYYGYSFVDYLQKEFEFEVTKDVPASPPDIPFWGDVFFV